MSSIRLTDPDFRICEVSFEQLLEIQVHAESQGWGTRWSTLDALRTEVKERPVLLRTLLREQRDGVVRAYRCVALYSRAMDDGPAGGVVTIDVDPGWLQARDRLDRDADVRQAFEWVFRVAVDGIMMISKK